LKRGIFFTSGVSRLSRMEETGRDWKKKRGKQKEINKNIVLSSAGVDAKQWGDSLG
jgi:hypothetical protein